MSAIVFPGDCLSIPSTSNVKLGPGLAVPTDSKTGKDQNLIVTLPGFLGQVTSEKGKGKSTSKVDQMMQLDDSSDTVSSSSLQQQRQVVAHWVESNTLRYLPALHDPIICQITNRGTESYQVTLFNSYTQATLSAFAFEGATKRNKPNLKVGSLLYAQVMSANRHLEVELTCVDQSTGKSNGYGELKTESSSNNVGEVKSTSEGTEVTAMIWKISCGLSKSLLKPSHTLLSRLALHFPFEVAIGVNGYVWVKAGQPRHVIAVGKVLERADKVKGSASKKGQEPIDALQVAKNRGLLSVDEIANIVRPYK